MRGDRLELMTLPKIAIIFIGTFFQQVLVIANTVRKVDPALVEAAQTLGASGWKLVRRVIIPASVTDIYTDMRMFCLVGRGLTSSWPRWSARCPASLTSSISSARYRNFDNVYAAIGMIGIIGFSTDLILAWLGTILFPWKRRTRSATRRFAWFCVAGATATTQDNQCSLNQPKARC